MPRNKYPEETVQKILDVSMKLFAEKGYEQTTVLDIVGNMGGLTRGAFYHHFKSKEEVLSAIMGRLFEESDPFGVLTARDDLNGLEKIRLFFFNNVIQASAAEGYNYIVLQHAAISLMKNPRFLAEQIKSNQELAQKFVPLITEGMEDGSIRRGNAKLLSELLMILFNFWMIPSIFPMDGEAFEEKSMMIKQILDGLGFPLINEALWDMGEDFAEILDIKE